MNGDYPYSLARIREDEELMKNERAKTMLYYGVKRSPWWKRQLYRIRNWLFRAYH